MATQTKYNPIPKAIALVMVSLCGAWATSRFDTSALAKIDSMAPAAYVQYERGLHHQSYMFHFIVFLILTSFFLGAIEVIAYVIQLMLPKKPEV